MANTKEQQWAIDAEGSNIIVSAGAGSGKTAVLTQRVIRKIMSGVDVSKLLVLTFTNEAASEMKNRIRDAIIKNNLTKQLNLLDAAYITTFDSYALSVVKKYAYKLNISKNIGIIDSNIITIYKYKVIDKIFDEMYGEEDFDNLINDFCLKDDTSLKKDIIKLSEKLDLQLDKEKYIKEYFLHYDNEEFIGKMINDYMHLIRNKVIQLKDIYEEFTSYCSDSLIKKIDEYFNGLFNAVEYDEYVLFMSKSSVRFTSVDENGLVLKEELKKKIEEIKKLLRFKDKNELTLGIEKTRRNIQVMLDIISKMDNEVAKYKDKTGSYEFNDIAHMALGIVQNNLEIREEIRNYFNEIMVDEYQDTSNIQEEFVSLISNNNVYMVGDVKQSIYRFRNANPYIFQDKYNRYSKHDGGIKIDLLKNFRSRNETLFNINEIFNLIMDDEIGNADYLDSHNMVYGNTAYDLENPGHDNNLEIYNYDNEINTMYTREEKEIFIISEDIHEKIKNKYQVFDKKSNHLREIKYSDICIITDRNKYLDKYKKILEYEEIPSVIYMDHELTNDNVVLIIKNLISLVDYVNKGIIDDKFRYLFVSVARSFIFTYSDDMIYQIDKNKKYYQDEIIKKCKLINLNNPLEDIINEIFMVFNIYEKLTTLSGIDEYLIRIDNILDIASNLSGLGYNLEEFINYIEDVLNKGLTIKYSTNTSVDNAVKIMNIHKSKGLEFSLCYFTGMHNEFTIKEINDKILISDKGGIILPYINENGDISQNILKDLYVDNFFKEEISEKIRLFYVALTRCREKMIIVTSLNKEKNGYGRLVPVNMRLKYRSFLDILNSIDIIDKYVVNKEANYTHDYDTIKLKEITKHTDGEVIDKKEIKINYEVGENKHFSKESDILDIDSVKAMKYGTLIHEELEYADFDKKNNKYLEKLFNVISSDYINVYREYEFSYQENNIVYNGVIDLMLEYDDYINIIDYKLKNIMDEKYNLQLRGYKKYIESISNKVVNIYLYSLIEDKILKIED